MIQIAIAVKEYLLDATNELLRTVGYSEADANTFTVADYKDENETGWAIAAGLVTQEFLDRADSELVEPEWGSDLQKAQEAYDNLEILHSTEVEELPESDIVMVVGLDSKGIAGLLNLTKEVINEEVIEDGETTEPVDP